MKQLTRNFHRSDFDSKDGVQVPMKYKINLIKIATNVQVIYDALQDEHHYELRITRGYSTPEHNASVGGASGSQHLYALAVDLQQDKLTPLGLYRLIERLIKEGRIDDGGLILYDRHVHYDNRSGAPYRDNVSKLWKLEDKPSTQPTNYAKAELLAPFILEAEGGLSSHSSDRSSANYCPTPHIDGQYYHTNKGITYATWASVMGRSRDNEFLNMSNKNWMQIFKTNYWNKIKASEIKSQRIANIIVDWHFGSEFYGIKYAQQAIGTFDDGIVGKNTLEAINSQSEKQLEQRLLARREQHFRSIARRDSSQKVFLNGWLNRLKKLKEYNEKF